MNLKEVLPPELSSALSSADVGRMALLLVATGIAAQLAPSLKQLCAQKLVDPSAATPGAIADEAFAIAVALVERSGLTAKADA